ncbi:hypothetical protein [Corallincola spongiicola]|uniref:Uncharacterized protein n=1 Tax=Corallincola spongiicola TaxID=2520508 RepID=A0ABY1WM13_9GAMM|nr:hypothetical protein [Corallincola spongiicola]TAA42636.1 hypothetical protein EXY25_15215 [Corallincola spongiicola]
MLPFLIRWLPQMLLSLVVVGASMALLWWRLASIKQRSLAGAEQSDIASAGRGAASSNALCGCQQRCSDHLYQISEPTDV